jgi:hypothetical protein
MATRYSNWLRAQYNVYTLPMPKLPKQGKDMRLIIFMLGGVAVTIFTTIAFYFAYMFNVL